MSIRIRRRSANGAQRHLRSDQPDVQGRPRNQLHVVIEEGKKKLCADNYG